PTATPLQPGPLLIEGLQAERLIGDPQVAPIFYALTPAGLYITQDGGRTWALVTPIPQWEEFVFSPAAPAILYAGLGYDCYRGGGDVPFYKSVDGGAVWTEVPGGINLRPVAVHPQDPQQLWAIGCEGPYFSADGGVTWVLRGGEPFQRYRVEFLTPVFADWRWVYVGANSEGGEGAIIASRDGGRTWQVLIADLPGVATWIQALYVMPHDGRRLFFATPAGIWISQDGGETWTQSTAGLEEVLYREGSVSTRFGFQALVAEETTGDLYLGSARGLYVSRDGGERWSRLEGGPWEEEMILDADLSSGERRRLYVTTAQGVFVMELPAGGEGTD
ncbi:MAG: hypothetical protein D6759_19235, partial [Chloroflexi bacterium]